MWTVREKDFNIAIASVAAPTGHRTCWQCPVAGCRSAALSPGARPPSFASSSSFRLLEAVVVEFSSSSLSSSSSSASASASFAFFAFFAFSCF